MNKTITKVAVPSFAVEVETYEEKRTEKGVTRPMQMNVEGMMRLIIQSFPTQDQRDMVREYAKFFVLECAGVESYPIVKKATPAKVAA